MAGRLAAPRRLPLGGCPHHPATPPTVLQAVYSFWQYELCDVFIELMKPVMALDDAGGWEGCA